MKSHWKKRKKSRPCFEWARAQGYSSMVSHLLACRYQSVETLKEAFHSELSNMDKPDTLPDIQKAAERIAKAVRFKEVIGIETDHDADGVTSHAVIYETLVDIFGHPKDKVRSYIGHRLTEGYGLSDSVANRILKDTVIPSLVITADNGSSDEPRIATLKAAGIDVIVTDHHEIPVEGIPASAFAVVSPAREDSAYPDPLIAGCMVACLTMAMARQVLIKQSYFMSRTPPPMSQVFDFVALGTVADCVSMSRSKNNRLVVKHGLKRINTLARPCWRALKPYLNDQEQLYTATDLGFAVGPRLNARGRLDEAMAGVHFLLSKDDKEASQLASLLDDENTARKQIERSLKIQAIVEAERLIAEGYQSLVIYLENGHAGVHGIVASRLVESYGRPTIIISPKLDSAHEVSASARGIDGFHVRQALQQVADESPGLMTKFGGHKGAAGLSMTVDNINLFREAFEEATLQQLHAQQLKTGPIILTDGELPYDYFTLNTIDQYAVLEPFGREMDAPVFQATLRILEGKRIGSDKTHLKLKVGIPSVTPITLDAVWFNAGEAFDVKAVQQNTITESQVLFQLSKNRFRGEEKLQLMIRDIH